MFERQSIGKSCEIDTETNQPAFGIIAHPWLLSFSAIAGLLVPQDGNDKYHAYYECPPSRGEHIESQGISHESDPHSLKKSVNRSDCHFVSPSFSASARNSFDT